MSGKECESGGNVELVQVVFKRNNDLGLSLKWRDDQKLESTSWE